MNEYSQDRTGLIPGRVVRRTTAPVMVGGHGVEEGLPPVKVIPVEQDGVIRFIEIHCSCGRVTVLECEYDEEEGK